jgi:hypothetical protein
MPTSLKAQCVQRTCAASSSASPASITCDRTAAATDAIGSATVHVWKVEAHLRARTSPSAKHEALSPCSRRRQRRPPSLPIARAAAHRGVSAALQWTRTCGRHTNHLGCGARAGTHTNPRTCTHRACTHERTRYTHKPIARRSAAAFSFALPQRMQYDKRTGCRECADAKACRQ